MLDPLNFGVSKFFNSIAASANQMVVMVAIMGFKNCFFLLKYLSLDQPGILQIREDTVNRRQGDIDALIK